MPNESSPLAVETPAALDVERAVLGAILCDPTCLYDIYDRLTVESFHRREHRLVWSALIAMFGRGETINLETLRRELERTGDLEKCGGHSTLLDIADSVMTAAHAGAHAQILIEKQRQRKLRATATSLLDRLNENPDDLVDWLEESISEVRSVGLDNQPTLDRQVEAAIQANKDVIEGKVVAYQWPIRELTRATKGIRAGKFYLLVALYKTGKSKLLTATLTDLVVDQQVPCLFFSLEMRSTQVLNWMAAYALKINSTKYGTLELSQGELDRTTDWMIQQIASAGRLHINDRSVHTPESICAEIRRAVMKYGIKVVFIDFLQKINFGPKDHVAEIERGVNLIVSTARDLGVAVVALSQVPKSAEKKAKGDNINMGDVKSSGAFAEAADCSISMTDPNRHQESDQDTRHLKFVVEGRDVRSRVLDIHADLRYGDFHSLIPVEAPETRAA